VISITGPLSSHDEKSGAQALAGRGARALGCGASSLEGVGRLSCEAPRGGLMVRRVGSSPTSPPAPSSRAGGSPGSEGRASAGTVTGVRSVGGSSLARPGWQEAPAGLGGELFGSDRRGGSAFAAGSRHAVAATGRLVGVRRRSTSSEMSAALSAGTVAGPTAARTSRLGPGRGGRTGPLIGSLPE
jgi:hypothetical protein